MAVIHYTPTEDSPSVAVSIKNDESVLDALLDAGFDIPFGCQSGVCQSCVMQASSSIPAEAQKGLKKTDQEKGYFLSCSCYPSEDIHVGHTQSPAQKMVGEVLEKQLVNQSILKLRFKADMGYKPGQFINLWRNDQIVRSYSLASTPESDNFMECHIKHIADGAFSDWAVNHLEVGDKLEVQGPLGNCFYALSDRTQPILLAGIGTGLAPLYGILRDALAKGHTGNITVLIGGKSSENFYMIDELQSLVKKHVNLCVIFIAQDALSQACQPPLISRQGSIYDEVKYRFNSLKNTAVYLCGAESFVKKMKKNCYLMDADLQEIYADAFVSPVT